MASRFFFAGRLHTTPIAVSQVDDTRMSPRNPAVGNNIALIGIADAGKPETALTFSNPREAERVLKGGELLTAVRKAFSPSASTGGPAKVTAVRVGTATRSTLTLKDAAAADAIVLQSDVYGLTANQIRVQVESGSLKGKRVTTRLGNDYYTADNLARDAFKIRYTGGLAGAKIDVTPTTVVLKAGTVGSEATIATINLVDTPLVQSLVDRINSYAGFVASAIGGAALTKTLRALDGLTGQDVKTADVVVKADLQAIIDWFNSNAELFVTASRPTGATAVPANLAYTFLTGATDPTIILQDWMDAIDVLTGEDVQWVVPLSSDATVHSAVDAHCIFMSSAGRKERRAFVGPALGLTVTDVKQLPRSMSSDRTALCWPGHYDTDLKTGERVLLPPYMTAVHVAGGFAGMNPGNAMTNKAIRVLGLEVNPSYPADTDVLIENGVCTFESTPKGIRCTRSISTWLENDNFNRVEVSCGAAQDYLVRSVREALEPLVGSKASPQILALAAQVTESVLKGLARPEPGGPGVIVGDERSPAYRNIQVSIEGDVLFVSFEASPVVPLNFIALSVSVVPYRGSLAV